MRYDRITRKERLHAQYAPLMRRRNRGLLVDHFESTKFKQLSEEELQLISEINHTWSLGDRYYKLAQKYYGSSDAWWVIALYNGRPTEAHIPIGATIYIPTPVGRVIAFYGY